MFGIKSKIPRHAKSQEKYDLKPRRKINPKNDGDNRINKSIELSLCSKVGKMVNIMGREMENKKGPNRISRVGHEVEGTLRGLAADEALQMCELKDDNSCPK